LFDRVTKYKNYVNVILCEVITKYQKNIFFYHGFRMLVEDEIDSGGLRQLSSQTVLLDLRQVRVLYCFSYDSNVIIPNRSATTSRFVES